MLLDNNLDHTEKPIVNAFKSPKSTWTALSPTYNGPDFDDDEKKKLIMQNLCHRVGIDSLTE